MAQKWSKKNKYTLLQGVGAYGYNWFCRNVGNSTNKAIEAGRSIDAIRAQAYRLFGSGSITKGAYSLRQCSELTGYTYIQLRRAMHAVNQKWKRTSKHGTYIITEDQLWELVEWLKHDYWCIKYRRYNCSWCTTDVRAHYSLGLCKRCFFTYYKRLERAGLPTNRKHLLKLVNAWQRNDTDSLQFLGTVTKYLGKHGCLTKDLCKQVIIYAKNRHTC